MRETERRTRLVKEVETKDAFIEREARHVTAAENFHDGNKLPVEFLRHK